MKTYDVVILGGGIIGLSCAYYLSLKNKKVALVEKNQIGDGSSGACDDMILLQSKKPGKNLELAIESLNLYKGLSKDLDYDIGFHSRGGMILIDNEDHMSFMENYVRQQKNYGLNIELLDKKDVKRYHPYVKDGIIASTHGTEDSQVYPLYVMRAFLSKTLKAGMDVYKRTYATELKKKSSYWVVKLENDLEFETENIINAAGAWSGEVGKLIGIDIPITSKKGQIIITESIPQLGKENIWSADYIISKLNPELVNYSERYKELGIGLSCSQASSGNYLIGSTREKGNYNKGTDTEVIEILVNQAVDFFPIFKNVHIIRTFAGFRPACEDGKPIISEVKGHEGYYIASGHEGDGIAMAPITGKLISQMICREKAAIDVDELSFERFN
ncbi:FAD-binding oxidoreductase [Sedimentibacter hydroxybenzoicus DSM 7310]|uniref:FAD-binding oxidoreductase n=1 Tax=Sedimentibacter hydroxybenzoicus DSM 7310 TaxID=1123245 RepID=A0A974GXQ2_SEDHY|nr:FAD-binding oxidoreductase [Sedimentibacter hydroxybenzoicus]NYB75788.1 FAD-binding oxidoreductase [Sedimentibacter hydroxybenzoicus DSM 7310]